MVYRKLGSTWEPSNDHRSICIIPFIYAPIRPSNRHEFAFHWSTIAIPLLWTYLWNVDTQTHTLPSARFTRHDLAVTMRKSPNITRGMCLHTLWPRRHLDNVGIPTSKKLGTSNGKYLRVQIIRPLLHLIHLLVKWVWNY